jgi:hypothetical protein
MGSLAPPGPCRKKVTVMGLVSGSDCISERTLGSVGRCRLKRERSHATLGTGQRDRMSSSSSLATLSKTTCIVFWCGPELEAELEPELEAAGPA